MFVSSNAHRSVASTFAFKNLQKSEIMQNDLNQSKNFKRTETNSSFDELKKNSDALKMLMLNLNERFEQAKRLLWDREKFQKLKKMKTKIRAVKREVEIIEKSTKKIESKEIEFFSNNLMQSIFISEKIVTSTVSNQKEDVTTSRKRTIKFDKILLYHDKSIKKHRDYVKNLTTTFRLILDDFSTKNSKIVYVMQFLAKKSKKKTWYRFKEQNFDHNYIFKKYCEHLLNLIENLINRHFHHAQFFSNAKQKKKTIDASFRRFFK
jgi:hypothetical protein